MKIYILDHRDRWLLRVDLVSSLGWCLILSNLECIRIGWQILGHTESSLDFPKQCSGSRWGIFVRSAQASPPDTSSRLLRPRRRLILKLITLVPLLVLWFQEKRVSAASPGKNCRRQGFNLYSVGQKRRLLALRAKKLAIASNTRTFRQLEFESRDLQLRELRDQAASLFKMELSRHPDII